LTFVGERNWLKGPAGQIVITDLVKQKTPVAVPKKGLWKVYCLGFSHSGWTDAAHRYADEISKAAIAKDNWHSVGMQLVDLMEFDASLNRWAE
jgi:hypothetical protein